jgi:hypothetical protein
MTQMGIVVEIEQRGPLFSRGFAQSRMAFLRRLDHDDCMPLESRLHREDFHVATGIQRPNPGRFARRP